MSEKPFTEEKVLSQFVSCNFETGRVALCCCNNITESALYPVKIASHSAKNRFEGAKNFPEYRDIGKNKCSDMSMEVFLEIMTDRLTKTDGQAGSFLRQT